jgi:hypothetical protein
MSEVIAYACAVLLIAGIVASVVVIEAERRKISKETKPQGHVGRCDECDW